VERAYALWRAFQERYLARAAELVLLGCTLLALLEVFRRYVIGTSYEWQQDAVTFFIVSAVFLYFGISQRRGAHLNVTAFLDLVAAAGPRGRTAVEVIGLVTGVFSMLFLITVVWWGIPEVVDGLRYESRTESLAFPLWPFLLVLLVGFAFMAVSLFFDCYRRVRRLRGHTALEEPADDEPVH
jgi:TRAP-type C4-dicarboxylate transport system permease small subunit